MLRYEYFIKGLVSYKYIESLLTPAGLRGIGVTLKPKGGGQNGLTKIIVSI